MKDDKICFPKTWTYLVLLVAAVVGGFWVINYANTQKLGGTPKASEGKGNWGKAVMICNARKNEIADKFTGGCRYFNSQVKGKYPVPVKDAYGSYCRVLAIYDRSACAPAVGSPLGKITPVVDWTKIARECKKLKDIIAGPSGNEGCEIYDGGYRKNLLKGRNFYCTLVYKEGLDCQPNQPNNE
ncbi:MAG: hypothetical protein AAB441_04630 [Patescibacteria group bacterium]